MRIYFMLVFGLMTTGAFGQSDVALKITYKGQAVCKYDIKIKIGDATIGAGVTDDQGNVSFSQVALISKSIDVYGDKKTPNGDKHFDVKGYVTLNDDFFYNLEMEVLTKEVASGSGMSEDFFAAAWGLNNLECGIGGNRSGGEPKAGDTNASQDNKSKAQEGLSVGASLPTKEESLAIQEQGFKNEIESLSRKIEKQQTNIEQLKVAGASEPEIEIESLSLEELKYKRERKKVGLERVQKTQQAALSSDENKAFNQREDALSAKEDEAKDKRKQIEKGLKEQKKNSNSTQTNSEPSNSAPSNSEQSNSAPANSGQSNGGVVNGGNSTGPTDTGTLKVKISAVKTKIKLKESSIERLKGGGKDKEQDLIQKERELLELKAELAVLEKQLGE